MNNGKFFEACIQQEIDRKPRPERKMPEFLSKDLFKAVERITDAKEAQQFFDGYVEWLRVKCPNLPNFRKYAVINIQHALNQSKKDHTAIWLEVLMHAKN